MLLSVFQSAPPAHSAASPAPSQFAKASQNLPACSRSQSSSDACVRCQPPHSTHPETTPSLSAKPELFSRLPNCQTAHAHLSSAKYWFIAVLEARTKSPKKRTCWVVHWLRISIISLTAALWLSCVRSKSRSSVLTSKTLARDTSTGRLSFVLPVSMWLMWVVEISTFSASSSWDQSCAFRNFRIRCPMA